MGDPLRIHGLSSRQCDRTGRRAAGDGRPDPRAGQPLPPSSSPAGSASASASPAPWPSQPRSSSCDEPVSALDVSHPGPDHQPAHGPAGGIRPAYIFIAHDLAVVRAYLRPHRRDVLGEDRGAGALQGPLRDPRHPYTQALLSAVPTRIPGRASSASSSPATSPTRSNPPSGCRFHPRCPRKFGPCAESEPPLKEAAPGHSVACFLPQ